jgi:hypothetical protein
MKLKYLTEITDEQIRHGIMSDIDNKNLLELRNRYDATCLSLSDCKNLESLLGVEDCESIVYVNLIKCPKLTSLEHLPNTRDLMIEKCEALTSIDIVTSRLTNLKNVLIKDCENLTSVENLPDLGTLSIKSSTENRHLDLSKFPKSGTASLVFRDFDVDDLRKLNGHFSFLEICVKFDRDTIFELHELVHSGKIDKISLRKSFAETGGVSAPKRRQSI